MNTEILSISVDTVWAHKVWKEISAKIKKVQFPMLSDNRRSVSKEYGVLDTQEGVAIRGRFIIDPDGILVGMEVLNNNVGRSAMELLRQLKAFQHVRENGDACPASWTDLILRGNYKSKPSITRRVTNTDPSG
jgi:peroxiredoxin (alkyl hydroperoxide reductase subunit C)